MKLVWILSIAFGLLQADEPHIKSAAAAYETGLTALQKGSLNDAVASFKEAIEIEPTYLEPRHALIRAFLQSGQRLEAATAITQLLEIEEEDIPERMVLGQILLDEKQMQRALAQFSLVLQKDPLNREALFGFASAAKALGMSERARDALAVGHKHYPLDKRFESSSFSEKQNDR